MVLGSNVLSGIAIARLLGPAGRGELAAITQLMTVVGWAFTMGCFQAVTFHHAKHPKDGARLLGTWLAVSIPLGITAVACAQLLVGTLFSAQSQSAIDLARWWSLTIPTVLIAELFAGVAVADQRFNLFNYARVVTAAGTVVLYLVWWASFGFSVAGALVCTFVAAIVAATMVALPVIRDYGIGRPSKRLASSGLWYGLRAHGANIGSLVTMRLDIVVMPAFLAASQIGAYAVAVSAASIVTQVSGSLAPMVLPSAVTDESGTKRHVLRFLHVTLILGILMAIPLALAAPWLLSLVYGSDFASGSDSLRILLPGSVLLAAATVLTAGLYAENRPGRATIAQLVGAAVTVVLLLMFLGAGGIVAAAWVSTIAYALTFVLVAVMYVRASGADARDLFDVRPTVADVRRRLSRRSR